MLIIKQLINVFIEKKTEVVQNDGINKAIRFYFYSLDSFRAPVVNSTLT